MSAALPSPFLSQLRLLQLADSAFPTGAYAFSDGLETLTQRGAVRTADDLTAFLSGQLRHGFGLQDVPACALAWSLSPQELPELDDLLDNLKLVRGPREASLRVGANLRKAALHLWPADLQDLPATRHHATVFGALARCLGAAQEQAVCAYVSAWLLGRVTSATRLMKLGGLDAQRCAARCEDKAQWAVAQALQATLDDFGGFSTLLDIGAQEQASLEQRLFQS